MTMRIERLSASLLFFFLAAFALTLSIYKPYYNWDLIGYIASAKSFEEQDLKSLHSFTYDQLRNSVPDETYEKLIQGIDIRTSSYRQAISTDSSAFKEQLPFYQIRPIYTGLIYLLYKTGINIVFATHMISGVAVVAAIFFLYLMSVSFLGKPLIYAVPPLAFLFGVVDLARYSTPDGLALLAVTLTAYLYLKKRLSLLLILLPIMLGIRTDLILFAVPLLSFIIVFEESSRWKAALSILISIVAYIAIGAYWENPGWSTIFHQTLAQYLTHPISMPGTLTAQHYFHALFKGGMTLIMSRTIVLYALVAAYSLYLIRKRTMTTSFVITVRSPSVVLELVCLIYVISHFLAFPAADNRFLSASYVIAAFSLLLMMTDYLKTSNAALFKAE